MKQWFLIITAFCLHFSIFAEEPQALVGDKVEKLQTVKVTFDASSLLQKSHSITVEDIFYDHARHRILCFIHVYESKQKNGKQQIEASIVIPQGNNTTHYYLMGLQNSDLSTNLRLPDNISLVPNEMYRIDSAYGVYKRPYIYPVTILNDPSVKASFNYNYGSYRQAEYRLFAQGLPEVKLHLNYGINTVYPPKMLIVYSDDKKTEKIRIQSLLDGRYFLRMQGVGASLNLTEKAKKQFDKIMLQAEKDALRARSFGFSQPLSVRKQNISTLDLFRLIASFLEYERSDLVEPDRISTEIHPSSESLLATRNMLQKMQNQGEVTVLSVRKSNPPIYLIEGTRQAIAALEKIARDGDNEKPKMVIGIIRPTKKTQIATLRAIQVFQRQDALILLKVFEEENHSAIYRVKSMQHVIDNLKKIADDR